MRKTLKYSLETTIFLSLLFLSVIIAVKSSFTDAVLDGVSLWFACILPTTFPYLVITALLSSLSVTGKFFNTFSPITKRVFRINGSVGYAFFMSLISGYPIGAKLVSDLRERNMLTQTEAVRASALCSTSSPVFLIGSVGGIMFNNPSFGIMLFASHILGVLCTGLAFSLYKRKDKPSDSRGFPPPEKVDNLFYESVYSSVISILVVGGLITVFYLLTEILIALKILSPLCSVLERVFGNKKIAEGLVFGIFECTKGLKVLASAGITPISLPIATAICSFGGISVIMQSVAFLKKAKIKTATFLFSKVLSAVFGWVFATLFSLICF